MRMTLAISLLLILLPVFSACGGAARPKPFILPEDWEAKSAEERLEYVFKEAGHVPKEGPTGLTSTTLTLLEVLPEQLKIGQTFEAFEEKSETRKHHVQQELVLPLTKVNLKGVATIPGSSGPGNPTTPTQVEIHVTVEKEQMLVWRGKNLMTGEPKDSTPTNSIRLTFRTDNACQEAARAILELARKAQGVPEPAPQPL